MKLIEYMKAGGMTVEVFLAHFAPQIGVSQGALKKLVYGERTPRLPLALKIEKVTHGVVKPQDFAQPEPAPEKAA